MSEEPWIRGKKLGFTRSERELFEALKDYLHGDKKEKEAREKKKRDEEERKKREEEERKMKDELRRMKEELEEIDEKLIKIYEERKMSTSWHLRVKSKMKWPIQKLVAAARMKRNMEEEGTRKGTLEEEVAPMMRGVVTCGKVFVNAGVDSIEEGQEGLEDEVDLWDEFSAIVEEWQNYGGFLEAHEGAAFKEEILFVEMAHEEAQNMNFFFLEWREYTCN